MVLKMAQNGDDLGAHVQFAEEPAHHAIVEIPLEPTLQENEVLQEKSDRGSGKLGPKLMVEKVAGSGVYYRAFVKSSKADRVLLYFPPDRESQKWEWVYKCSSRIHRGTVSGRCSWKYQGEGAWKVQVKPNKKKGASRPKGCKKPRVHVQAEGCKNSLQHMDPAACARYPINEKAPSKESENATASCSSLQADISTGERIGSRHEENPVAAWFQRHSVLCVHTEERKRRPDLGLDCKQGRFSLAADSLCTPAPFVEYLHTGATGEQSNVLSSSGSTEHWLADATRFSSLGGAERREKVDGEVAEAGNCQIQDGDDGSNSTLSLQESPSGIDHVSHAVETSPQRQRPHSAVSPDTDGAHPDQGYSPCQDRKDSDLRETSSMANDSSDTGTIYGHDVGSCAYVARKQSGAPTSRDAQRQLCS
eukprot:jgi/Ulvmu1/4840/UM020_0126.1